MNTKNNKAAKKEQKPQQVSFLETQEYIIEQIYDHYRVPEKQFCLYNKAKAEISYVPELELESGKKIIPIQSTALIDKQVVLLPSEATKCESEEELVKAIKAFIHIYLDIHPFYENLAAYYVLMTWVFDQLSCVPYLRALGDFGAGKTRLIQTIGSLCYKPMFLAGATSDAYIFRVIEMFGGTLVLNELERVNTDMQSQITIILNNGYEKGMPVGRVEGERLREPRTFDVFCPKIISTRKRFKDQALESRIISIPMKQTAREDIPSFLDETFWQKAEQLRNRLLMYRFNHFGEFIWRQQEQEEKRQKLQTIEPRLKQTLLPLFFVINDKKLEDQFISYAKEFQLQMITDRGNEFAAVVFEKLYSLFQDDNKRVSVKDVTEAVNTDIEKERDKFTSQRIGKIIREELGLKTEKSTGGLFYIVYNEKQISYLIAHYGVGSPLTPSSPLSDSNVKEELVDLVDSDATITEIEKPAPRVESVDSTLSNETLQQQEKQTREQLQLFDKNSPEYEDLYHKWFALRDEGEKRGLWNFIPSPSE